MTEKPYILVFDHGTSGVKACLLNRKGQIKGKQRTPFEQIYPKPGWVEHDPITLWQLTLSTVEKALKIAKASWSDVQAIGMTNQRETTILWNRRTGNPIYNAIVWQDRRTSEYCDELKSGSMEPMIRKKTGLLADPYFSGTKIRWILKNVQESGKIARQGDLLFGTVDTWIIWNLTGRQSHFSDTSNASRTLIYNIYDRKWDPDLLKLFEIPEKLLPEVKHSIGNFGETDPNLTGGCQIPILGVAGDQQAALFGQKCWKPGTAKGTYGTGTFLVLNLGEHSSLSEKGLITTLACNRSGDPCFAMEGSIFLSGGTLEWLSRELQIMASAKDADVLASTVSCNEGVYLVPAFAGLAAPYWDSKARGLICGLTQRSGRAHIARAAIEAMAYQTKEVVDIMQKEAGVTLQELRVDGGVTGSRFFTQFLADILDIPIIKVEESELTAKGAGYLAGLASGFWQSPEAIAELPETTESFEPRMPPDDRDRLFTGWLQAVKRARL